MRTKHITIMFIDIKGYTSATSLKSRKQISNLLEKYESIVYPVLRDFSGKVVKTIGDAFMVVFESPTDAVLCGIKVQEKLREYNEKVNEDEKIEVKIAINSGEVNIKDNDVFGEPVNIAARIESIAEPNEVYFTEAVYLSMNKSEIPSSEVGHRYLKGIPEEIKVYKVVSESKDIEKSRQKRLKLLEKTKSISKEESHAKGKWKKWLYAGIIIFIVIIILVSLQRQYSKSSQKEAPIEVTPEQGYGNLKVSLTDADGNPVVNLEVDLSIAPGPPTYVQYTNEKGIAFFEKIPEGNYVTYFNLGNFPPEFAYPSEPAPITIIRDTTIAQDIVLNKK